MRHTILTTLLTLGVIGGLTYGLLQHRHERWAHHSRFKEHVADLCVEATLRTIEEKSKSASSVRP